MSEETGLQPTKLTAQITLKSGAQIEIDLNPQAEDPMKYQRDQGNITLTWSWMTTGRRLLVLPDPEDIAAIVVDRSYEEES